MTLKCQFCKSENVQIAEYTRRKVWNAETSQFEAAPAIREFCNTCEKWGAYPHQREWEPKQLTSDGVEL